MNKAWMTVAAAGVGMLMAAGSRSGSPYWLSTGTLRKMAKRSAPSPLSPMK